MWLCSSLCCADECRCQPIVLWTAAVCFLVSSFWSPLFGFLFLVRFMFWARIVFVVVFVEVDVPFVFGWFSFLVGIPAQPRGSSQAHSVVICLPQPARDAIAVA